MTNNNVIFILGLLLLIGWFGTTAYGHYTQMKSEIMKAESNSKDFQKSIEVLGETNVAYAQMIKAELDRAIDLLAEKAKR